MYEIAPIVLFVYNRPWHTIQTVGALQRNEMAGQSDLIIYSDGPKTEADKDLVCAVRRYIKKIKGFKKIIITERDENLGLAKSIISGVTEVINQYGCVIVLEDDLVTSPYFLSYMNNALEKYKNNENVMQVAGYMFPNSLPTEFDAVFLPLSTTWTWGTWKRAWDRLDLSRKGYEKLKKDKKLRKEFNLNGSYDFFRLYNYFFKGKSSSWGIFWYSTVFFNKGIVLYPVNSLAYHIGFDNSGTNCGATGLPQQELNDKPVEKLPEEVHVDNVIYETFLKDFKAYWKCARRMQTRAGVKKAAGKLIDCISGLLV